MLKALAEKGMWEHNLKVPVRLRERIEDFGRRIQSGNEQTLRSVQELKNTINKLEQRSLRPEDLKALNSAIDRLNQLIDFQITRSKKAWEECRQLEQECEQHNQRPVQLSNLKGICKKTEELAADLLCYSLAHFKQSERQS